jgi:hypothetical protein
MSAYSSDLHAEQMRRLSNEVSRLATSLARLCDRPVSEAQPENFVDDAELPELGPETLRELLQARRLRSRFFPEDLFADPAWDILLDLLLAEITQQRICVSSACIAAAVPATTALRWIKSLENRGFITRRYDPQDARRVFVELSSSASGALRRYFANVGPVCVI